jgi:hypothetical protein
MMWPFGKNANRMVWGLISQQKIAAMGENSFTKKSIGLLPPMPPFVAVEFYRNNKQEKVSTGYALSLEVVANVVSLHFGCVKTYARSLC